MPDSVASATACSRSRSRSRSRLSPSSTARSLTGTGRSAVATRWTRRRADSVSAATRRATVAVNSAGTGSRSAADRPRRLSMIWPARKGLPSAVSRNRRARSSGTRPSLSIARATMSVPLSGASATCSVLTRSWPSRSLNTPLSRLVSSHTTGRPISREIRVRSVNRLTWSAQCRSSIAMSSGPAAAACSSREAIRSARISGSAMTRVICSYSAAPASGVGPVRRSAMTGAPGQTCPI